jgi:hypothetical protein
MVDLLSDEFEFYIITSDRDYGASKPYKGVKLDQWCSVGKAQVFYASDAILLIAGKDVGEKTKLENLGKENNFSNPITPNNPQILADRILELIENESLRLQLGSAMRTRIENVFAIDKIAEVYKRAYELIISGHNEQIGLINPDLFGKTGNELCAD